MSLCINPRCPQSSDPLNANNNICRNCGSELLLQQRYRVIRLLSDTSGFGTVYEADDQGERKILKVLKEHLNAQPKAVELFQKEAIVLSQLRHPGIPRVEEDGYFTFLVRDSDKSFHCLVMEKIEGLNLEQWMHNRGNQPITSEQALEWLTQITQILAQVHQQDYFHRDIKPPNIMRRPNGQLVLIDFGTAREVTGTYLAKIGGSQNVTGIVSVGYTPPEQAGGRAVPQSDFFALGRTFVYLLTGKHPNDLLEDPRTGELLWRETGNGIKKSLADLIDYMMAPFPGNRPQNTQVILDQLAEVERTFNSPISTFEPSQDQTLTLTQPNLPKPSESIQSHSISPNQSTQQKPLVRQFDSSKWLAGGTVLLLGLGGIGYWQFTQKPLSSTPAITNTTSVPPAVTNTSPSPSPPATTNTSPSPSAINNASPLPQRNSSEFPDKSQAGGVTLKVLSVRQQGDKLLLNVKLKNEGANSVRFDENSWNVTDDQNIALLPTTDGLPKEIAVGEDFSGTVSVQTFSLGNANKLSLTLTDFPDRQLQLTISQIPVRK
ncbi:MAG TPA: serine/threonine-protein kinase [Oculatellaceae cyanobacterium]